MLLIGRGNTDIMKSEMDQLHLHPKNIAQPHEPKTISSRCTQYKF